MVVVVGVADTAVQSQRLLGDLPLTLNLPDFCSISAVTEPFK